MLLCYASGARCELRRPAPGQGDTLLPTEAIGAGTPTIQTVGSTSFNHGRGLYLIAASPSSPHVQDDRPLTESGGGGERR